jgi:hypothetical protein
MVGAKTFPGNPYDGHILHKQLTQTQILLENAGSMPQRRWFRRRQAVEPAIGHLKSDHRMDRCWLQGKLGDSLHAVLCAAGYNLSWLMRAVLRLGLKGILLCLALLRLINRFRAKQPYIGEACLYTKPPPWLSEFCRADYLPRIVRAAVTTREKPTVFTIVQTLTATR